MNYIAIPGMRIKHDEVRRAYGRNYKTVPAKAENIIKCIEGHFGYSIAVLRDKSRKREICYARQVLMFLLLNKTNLSLQSIAGISGVKDHTTVIHAKRLITDLMETYEMTRNEINDLMDNF